MTKTKVKQKTAHERIDNLKECFSATVDLINVVKTGVDLKLSEHNRESFKTKIEEEQRLRRLEDIAQNGRCWIHKYSRWKVDDVNPRLLPIKVTRCCNRCGKEEGKFLWA